MKNQDNGKTGGKRSLRDVKLSLLREFDPQTAISVFDVLKEYPEKEWRTILTIARSWIKSGQWGSPRNQIKSVMDWLGGGTGRKAAPLLTRRRGKPPHFRARRNLRRRCWRVI